MTAQATQYIREAVELRDQVLMWRSRPASHFANESYANRWNKQFADKPLHLSIAPGDYARINIGDRHFLAHRVIWFLTFGDWPNGDIDHVNGIRHDNRIENLRVVTRSENCRNMARRSDNTSGCSGVHWNISKQRWEAAITVQGRRRNLGSFISKSDAVAVRRTAQTSLGFTKRHGASAR